MLFNNPKKNETLNTEEAYSIWSALDRRYSILNHLRVQENFIHDTDFKYIMGQQLKKIDDEAKKLATELEKANITAPQPSVRKVNLKGNTEASRDEDIAWILHDLLKNEIITITNTFKDSKTNDHVRKFFITMLNELVDNYINYTDYIDSKGWLNTPPLYQYVPNNVTEKLASNEAYNLWHHVFFRYANEHSTNFLKTYVEDKDFLALLEQGLRVLKKQAQELEEILLKFGIALPVSYANVIEQPESKQKLDDKFIFLVILNGMQFAAALHGNSVAESFVNKNVRKLFRKLLFEELDVINNMNKYGKVKGWVIPPPKFTME